MAWEDAHPPRPATDKTPPILQAPPIRWGLVLLGGDSHYLCRIEEEGNGGRFVK